MAEVRRVAAEIAAATARIDVLLNNAGAIFSDRRETGEGLERTFALNHMGYFLLTTLLLPALRAAAPSRVVVVASEAHRGAALDFDDLQTRRWGGWLAYRRSKLANILFTRELARRLVGTGVEAYAFHPGFVASGFNRNNGVLMGVGMALVSPFARNTAKGAETLVWLADSPEADGQSGGYFYDRRRVTPTAAAQDDAAARRLWEISEQQVAAVARR
jgi:NAD(P)-dependent dehydrogenase (short-subunit alcohol dehydrogenase family)